MVRKIVGALLLIMGFVVTLSPLLIGDYWPEIVPEVISKPFTLDITVGELFLILLWVGVPIILGVALVFKGSLIVGENIERWFE